MEIQNFLFDQHFALFIAVTCALVAAIVVLTFYRYYANGKWAAGYWWSQRDRELGPGS